MLINLFYDEVAKVKPAAVPPPGVGAEMCMFLPGLQYYFGEEGIRGHIVVLLLLTVLVDPCNCICFDGPVLSTISSCSCWEASFTSFPPPE